MVLLAESFLAVKQNWTFGKERPYGQIEDGKLTSDRNMRYSNLTFFFHRWQTQMQMDNIREKKYTGSFHCLTTLTRDHGLKVVYTGHTINTLREATFLMTYFFVYEGFRGMLFETEWMNPKDKSDHHTEIHKWAIPVAGGLAGAIGWAVSFPLECVRMGVQGQTVDNTGKWKGSVQVFKELMENRGIRALYRGVTPTILRAFLVSGSRFSAYETALWLLRGGGWDQE